MYNMQTTSRKIILPFVTSDLFGEIERLYSEEGKFSDESLLALHAVFGAPFERALEMLEKDCVTLLTTANDTRQALQVSGGRGELYTLFPNINFCPCLAYAHQVVTSRIHVSCKHVLAARLSQVMGRTTRKEASPEEVARILCLSAHADKSIEDF
ncbi:zinc finger SWIM domain-containing protein 7 [Frankliniella occidentalis]|uniref:Zinc finger SWIM domain-containing protein 7 n=1 Tax=Frankliniella occidentalis TaxID=133901 RepID=A0A6J1SXT4_FRAOC|nr:zinc finger SWIM domain-containing protein 7 [Frankliniella occidentalis]